MFGRVVKLKTLDKRPGLFGREGFIKGSLRMSVEVVTDQQDFLGLCKASREQFLHLQRPVEFGALRTDADLPPSLQGLGEHEDAGRAVAFVFVVHATRMLLRGRNGIPGFLEQLHRLLVHAKHRKALVARFLVGLQHVLHAGNELTVGCRRNHPILNFPLRDAVFFRVLRTVS